VAGFRSGSALSSSGRSVPRVLDKDEACARAGIDKIKDRLR
jgi:hypothetical protein